MAPEAVQPLLPRRVPRMLDHSHIRQAATAGLALVAVLGCAASALRGAGQPRAPGNSGAAPACGPPPECLHALGGGAIRSGGDFPHLDPPGCKAALSAYITSGTYHAEVNASIAAAYSALGLRPPSGSGGGGGGASSAAAGQQRGVVRGSAKQLVVFDIDETALSNIIEFQQEGEAESSSRSSTSDGSSGGGSGGRLLRVAPRGAPAEWDAFVAANAASPALAATLQLYNDLCDAGYSLAFVTGRGEAARAATAANLRTAGYGARCANATRAPGEGCCYIDLVLRPPGDTRLASVYKPWAREGLAAKGFDLLASFGDQYSDLNGMYSTQYAFKLPNPFYFIL